MLLVVATTACAALTVEPTSPSTVPSTTTTTTNVVVTTTTSTLPTTTTTTVPLGPPLGLITPTGVPVAIRLVLPDSYLVYTPCGNVTRVRDGEPIYRTPVVLDPGHGGNRDVGAQGRNGLPEKVANLRVAFETQRVLAEKGIPSVLTRTDDYATTLSSRSRLADTLGAEILVSIHHNAPTPGPSPIPGNEVFIQSHSAESRRLGGLLYEYTVRELQRFDIPWTAARDAGVLTVVNSRGADAYGMIRLPQTPSALLELGYMSNPVEAELFATDEYLEVAGRAIADAVEAYLSTDQPGSGWHEPGRVFNPNPGLSQSSCIDPDLE
jgi:N-acetylmuramoyl-L-alanine amidase